MVALRQEFKDLVKGEMQGDLDLGKNRVSISGNCIVIANTIIR